MLIEKAGELSSNRNYNNATKSVEGKKYYDNYFNDF